MLLAKSSSSPSYSLPPATRRSSSDAPSRFAADQEVASIELPPGGLPDEFENSAPMDRQSPTTLVEPIGAISTSSTLVPTITPQPQRMQWRRGKMLGTGANGKVFLGMNETSGRLIAAKQFTFDVHDEATLGRIANLQREIQIMKKVQHPNVVSYLGADRMAQNEFYIFMEFVPGGSLLNMIHDAGALSEHLAALYTTQILTGVAFLHDSQVVHRDIKCANILVTCEGVIKLADFGSAHIKEPNTTLQSMEGSANWMAPEVIRNDPSSFASDLWSVGCTLMEMMTGKPPWSHLGNGIRVMNLVGAAKAHLPLPSDLVVSVDCLNFLDLCLDPRPNNRPSARTLLTHPFLIHNLTDEAAVGSSQQNELLQTLRRASNAPTPVGEESAAFRSSESPSLELQSISSTSTALTLPNQSRGSVGGAFDVARRVSLMSATSLKEKMSKSQKEAIVKQALGGRSVPAGIAAHAQSRHPSYDKPLPENGGGGSSTLVSLLGPVSPRQPSLSGSDGSSTSQCKVMGTGDSGSDDKTVAGITSTVILRAVQAAAEEELGLGRSMEIVLDHPEFEELGIGPPPAARPADVPEVRRNPFGVTPLMVPLASQVRSGAPGSGSEGMCGRYGTWIFGAVIIVLLLGVIALIVVVVVVKA